MANKIKNIRPLLDRVIFEQVDENFKGGVEVSGNANRTSRLGKVLYVGDKAHKSVMVGDMIRYIGGYPYPVDIPGHSKNVMTIDSRDITIIENADGTYTLPSSKILIKYDKIQKEFTGGIITVRGKEDKVLHLGTIITVGEDLDKELFHAGDKILCNEKAGTPLYLSGEREEYYVVCPVAQGVLLYEEDNGEEA